MGYAGLNRILKLGSPLFLHQPYNTPRSTTPVACSRSLFVPPAVAKKRVACLFRGLWLSISVTHSLPPIPIWVRTLIVNRFCSSRGITGFRRHTQLSVIIVVRFIQSGTTNHCPKIAHLLEFSKQEKTSHIIKLNNPISLIHFPLGFLSTMAYFISQPVFILINPPSTVHKISKLLSTPRGLN